MPIASELTIDNTASATTLMQTIFGSGVTITAGTASLTGAGTQSGTYSGGTATLGEIAPADTGIILSTGNVADFTNSSGTLDTNTTSGTSSAYGGAGDADLNTVTGQATEDAVVLSADFTTTGDFITMQFTFSSEEYLEYVNGGVNDAFGVWVNDVYAPFTPATNNLVSIDTINDTESSNLYLNNDAALDTYNTEMDGTTVTVSIKAAVNSVGSNTIKIALADGGDDEYDSNVLIAANSVQTVALAFDDTLNMLPSSTATFDLLANDTDTTGTGLTITEINGQSIVAGGSVTLPTGESVTLNADNTITVTNDGDIGSEAFTYKVLDGAGNTDIGFATINTTTTLPLDYIVEGSAGADLIDSSYVGDPEGDRIDNLDHSDASNDDSVLGGGGDDTIITGLGDDTVYGDTGATGSGIPVSVDSSNFSDTSNGYTITAQNVVGGVLTAPSAANVVDGGGWFGASGTISDSDSGVQQQIGYDLASGTSETLIVDFDDPIDALSFTTYSLQTGSFGEVGHYALYNDGVLVYETDFTDTTGTGNDTFSVSGHGDFDQIVFTALIQTDATDGSDFGISDLSFTLPPSFDDSINSGDGDDLVFGEAGNDTINAGLNNDTVDGGAGNDSILAGGGADSIVGGTGDDTIFGQSGADTILGGDGADSLDADGGNDSVDGGLGDDTIIGDAGNDTLNGGAGADEIYVSSGNNIIDGGTDNDTIFAGSDQDTILDSAGDDSVSGGAGKDTFDYTTLTGNDTIFGGEINDTTPTDSGDKIDAHDGVEGLSVVFSGDEAGTVTGASGTVTFSEIEHFMGGQGSDTIDASASSVQQILDGGEGSDTIQGGSGDDIIAMGMTQDFSATDGDDDLLILEDGFGNDSIEGFEVPTDLGGGTYSGNDQVDVSGLTNAGGDPVDTGDVTVTDTNGDGTGDAILTFPNGESITLWGVLASEVETPAQLQAIGIPAEPVTINDAILLDAIPGGSDTLTAGSELLSVTDGLEFDVGTAGSLNIGDTTVIGGVTYTISQILSYEADMTNTGGIAGTETIGYFIIELDDGAGTTIPYMLLGDEFSDKELITEVEMQFTAPAVGGIPIVGYDDDDVVTLAPSAALNYIVEGTAGADTIDASYTGDPEGDMVDAGDNLAGNDDDSIVAGGGADFVDGDDGDDTIDAGDGDDTVLGGLGDDSILGGLGNDNIMAENGSDTIYAGEGDDTVGASIGGDLVYGEGGNDSLTGGGYAVGPGDTIYGGTGNDTISGGGGADSLYGDEDDDSIDGGVGDDTLEGGTGNDTLVGGDGNDSINGDFGDDSIVGGAGDDFLRGSFGDDTLVGGTGDDTLWGGFGDDSIVVDADFGDYIIEGEEEAEVLGDTMDVSAVTDDLTWDLTNANPEAGSFTDGTNTGTYVDIENIILGSGTDTLTLGTFGGSDTVTGFTAPTDTGGGTFSGNDMLDVSGLLDFDGNPTHTGNVTVADDGSGNAQLTFANGETLTLVGVAVGDVSSPAQLIAMGIPEGPDGYVDGTSGDDTIDSSYTGDPNFDLVDNNDALLPGMSGDDDYIRAGAGNDSVVANIGDDIVEGGTGNDTIEGGTGDDTLSGEADDDSLVGGLGNDSMIGGAGDDTLNGQIGDDVLEGGDGSDSFALEDDFGSDTITGGEVDDAAGDVLDLSAVGGALTYDLTGTDAESGTVTDGTGTIEFSEIETIQLSSGTDTLTLANGSGDDVVTGFTAPVLDGGGSYIGFDQLDVSTMTDANGAMVNTGDVTITDTNGDGTGDTILTFPGGETLTLVGVLPSAFPVPEALAAIGIPLADYIVEGTAAGEVIDGSYMGDPEGDLVDAGDAENGSDDDIIEAGAGADTVTAGAGDDSVFGDEGADEIDAGAGDDTVFGGDDDDTISGGADNDSLLGQDGADSIAGETGDDYLEGGVGEDTLEGGADNDTLDGGADNDLLDGGAGDDSLLGSFGDDTLRGGAGNDTMSGGFGDDTFELSDGFGDDIIDGEADFETNGDTLDASGVTAEGVSIVYSGDESGTLTGAVTGDEADFFDIENVTATDNDDTIDAALDTVGVNVDAGDGEDVVTGGSGEDTLDGGDGDDVLSGGTDGDLITAGAGDDTINVGQGDTVTGGDGDDFFNLVDLGEIDTDTITITGGEGGETDGDTLALNGLHDRDSLVITDPDDVNGGLSGTVTLLDGTVVNFTNIENIICFVPGTEIATPYGARMIEDLSIGDHVVTQDNGVQRIRWIGTTTVPATDKFAPVRFDQSTFPGASADLVVSPQHRMLFKGYQAELLFGENEVLIPAIHLIDGKSVQRESMETVTYIHIMFEQHEIIFAQGVATESFHPGSFGVDCLAPKARDELFTLFPQMRSDLSSYGQSARTSLRATEAKVLMQF